LFTRHNHDPYLPLIAGIGIKTLVYGEKTLLSQFQLAQGHKLPRHSRPYEQTGYLISGRRRLTIGSQAFEVEPGDSWCIPAGIEHQADVLEDSIALELFSPARPDYLPEALAKR